MALNIITSDQAVQVSSIITYIYADPGLGKTSIGFTAVMPFLLTSIKVYIVLVNYAVVLSCKYKSGQTYLRLRLRT
ncbi:hypothetical protein SAMN05421733_1086 [Acinetobacter boissieri]|uniref:Uncharacterized protein n=1 Tax=Acinetobacter boissieri TaxID=1219383 RepID=A0A1G6IAD9_9GAMM|nr:hypothetical protein SAMN05421733_1086 [Acinetobacter boissieri]